MMTDEAKPLEEESTDTTPDPEELQKALEEQTGKAESHFANWQRAEADLANYKKRVDLEKQELATFANAMLLTGFLSVLDDMDRAFETVDPQLAKVTWIEGLQLIYKKMQSTLEAQGLSVIETLGESFDPKVHEAVMEMEGDEGKVISEIQKGYRFRARVLRPAMVTVGRGKKAEEDTSEEDSSNA